MYFSKKTLLRRAVFLLFALLLPISVSAGLVGALSSFFLGNSLDENILKNRGVQDMAILVPTDSSLAINTQILPSVSIENNALVPEVGPLGQIYSTSTHKATSDQISIYVVRDGDTLSQIAEMFNVTVNTIKWGNDLSSNVLKEGQNLVILPISGVRHTVVKGDTIASLVKKYKGNLEEILAYNDLSEGSSLVIGSEIIIPDGEILASPVSSSVKIGSSNNLKDYSGYYIRPIVGGKRSQGVHGYNGVDLAAPLGTPIIASADGEVIISRSSGWNGGYGSYIVIRHANGTQTLYAHNSVNNVSVGDFVSQGDVIGAVGKTGKATGYHVHFEIRGAKNPF